MAMQPTAASINEHYVRFYINSPVHFINKGGKAKLSQTLGHSWACGITYEQAIIHAMELGFSMCVVIPQVQRVYAGWDADYAAYQNNIIATDELDVESL